MRQQSAHVFDLRRCVPVRRAAILALGQRTSFRRESIGRGSAPFPDWRVMPITASSDFLGRSIPVSRTSSLPSKCCIAVLPDQIPQFDLIRNVPTRITRTVMRQGRRAVPVRPAANVAAGDRDQMFDDRRAEYFHEKILVRLRFPPELLRVFLAFPARAHRDQHRAVRLRLGELIVEPPGGKFRSADAQFSVRSIPAHSFAARKTTAGRFPHTTAARRPPVRASALSSNNFSEIRAAADTRTPAR